MVKPLGENTMKEWLSPHGRSYDMAKWVVDTKGHLIHTDEYKDNETVRQWINHSQLIVNSTIANGEMHFTTPKALIDADGEMYIPNPNRKMYVCKIHGEFTNDGLVQFNLAAGYTGQFCLKCIHEHLEKNIGLVSEKV